MSNDSRAPIYSLVTFGRNDDYNPDFLYRLQTTLNFNGKALEKAGLHEAVEFVVVDWGSKVPLRDVLILDEAVASSTSFLELSAELVAQVTGDPTGMHVSKAANVGIRRARGQFVGIQGADLLMSSTSWRSLIMVLENQCLSPLNLSKACLLVPRRQMPWSFVARRPSLDKWEWKLLTCEKTTAMFEGTSPSTAGSMGIVILHGDVWHEAKGLEESFSGYGYYDIDLGFRVGTQYQWVDAASCGVVCHKMQHDPKGRRGQLLKRGQIHMNAPWVTPSIHARQSDWGLPHIPIEPKRAISKVAHGNLSPSENRWSELLFDPLPADPALFATWNIQKHASAALGRSQDFNEKDWELLLVLSWIGLNRLPANYLEVGMVREWFVRAVVTACPSVDVFVLESVQQSRDMSYPRSLDVASSLIWKWGHKGYFRPMIGNPAITLEWLARSFMGPFELELVLVWLQGHEELRLLPPAALAIAPGGLMAIQSNRAELLIEAIEQITKLTSMDTRVYIGKSGCTGFIFFLATSVGSSKPITHEGKYLKFDPSGMIMMFYVRASIFMRQVCWVVSRICRVLRWPLYSRLIIAKVFSRS